MPLMLTIEISKIDSAGYKTIFSKVFANGAPDGLLSHICYGKGTGICIIDIWDSKKSLDNFRENLLIPALEAHALDSEPDVLVTSNVINSFSVNHSGKLLSE